MVKLLVEFLSATFKTLDLPNSLYNFLDHNICDSIPNSEKGQFHAGIEFQCESLKTGTVHDFVHDSMS